MFKVTKGWKSQPNLRMWLHHSTSHRSRSYPLQTPRHTRVRRPAPAQRPLCPHSAAGIYKSGTVGGWSRCGQVQLVLSSANKCYQVLASANSYPDICITLDGPQPVTRWQHAARAPDTRLAPQLTRWHLLTSNLVSTACSIDCYK